MLSKNTIKLIKSLQIKKYRYEHQLFLVEGRKSVLELFVSDFSILHIVATQKFTDDYSKLIQNSKAHVDITNEATLASLGTYDTNDAAIAIVQFRNPEVNSIIGEKILALDTIQDPGNLGTIIRTADWFGISDIYCSENTVDMYNPKVIASSMGSFARVNIIYCDLEMQLSSLKKAGLEIYGAYMNGQNIDTMTFKKGILLMGNEANGISSQLEPFITRKIGIVGKGNTESLNVAVAAGIILSRFCK